MPGDTDRAFFYLLLGGVIVQMSLIGMLLYELHVSNQLMHEVHDAFSQRSAWEAGIEQRLDRQEAVIERVLPRVEQTLSQLLQQMGD